MNRFRQRRCRAYRTLACPPVDLDGADAGARGLLPHIYFSGENIPMSNWTRWLKTLVPSTRTRRAARKANAAEKPGRRMSVEHLETRLAPAAAVWTDKPDYAPGSVATFTAGNSTETDKVDFNLAGSEA